MKIIMVDNYDRESVSDSLIAENVQKWYADCMCATLNKQFSGETSSCYFRVVEDDHKLYVFKP